MQNKENIKAGQQVNQLGFFQSANADRAIIKQNFVVRITEFQLIIDDLKNKKKNDPLQHELLLGRRGSGKSTLLKRIQIEIDDDPTLSNKYIAINLAEEQARIYRLFDLWESVLKELSFKLDYKMDIREDNSFSTGQDYTRYLYGEVHEILQKSGKKIVLLLDNIDRVFENLLDDGNLLREILINYNDLQIIGGSTKMGEHFWKYDKPFYEFFRRHHLETLTTAETHLLLDHWSSVMNLPQLAAFAAGNPGKIEAIRILTDGQPRTLQFFIRILLHDSTLYGFDYIRDVMDNISPLYQDRLANLSPLQRKIVLEMAFIWEACTVKQLAEKCKMESKLLSAQLQKLSALGIVETIATSKKNHLYRLFERFFNMWLIITQGDPDQKRKAKWLSIFLETWYDSAQLKDLTLEHIKNLKAEKLPFDKAIILTKAFSQIKHISTRQRDEMLDYTTESGACNHPSPLIELPPKYKAIKDKITKLIEKKQFRQAFELTNEIENEGDGMKFFIQGWIRSEEGNFKEAEKNYLLASEKGSIEALNKLSLIYYFRKKHKAAEKYWLIAIEKGDTGSMNLAAVIYRFEGKYETAEKYFLMAIEKGNIDALYNLAVLYYDSNRNRDAALKLIRKYCEQRVSTDNQMTQIIIEIWNGFFENLEDKVLQIITERNYENIDNFLKKLLIQQQTYFVLDLFQHPVHGKILQDRYTLIYYATMLIARNESIDNLTLRIPPEVSSTVSELLTYFKVWQEIYSNHYH